MVRMWFYLCLVISLLVSFNAWSFDKLSAKVDKNPAMLDESITLTVEANASLPRDAFDTSVLEKDFKVVRTSVSNQMRKINLRESVSTTWTTILFPRTTGRLTIPAIKIYSIQSDPIDVLVVPVSQARSQTRDIFMTASVIPETGYVQQQLTYQVRLYLAVELERGSLQVPDVENVMMEQMGEDIESTAIQNGKRYRVIERNFSIIPQESGPLTLPSPIFEGSIIIIHVLQLKKVANSPCDDNPITLPMCLMFSFHTEDVGNIVGDAWFLGQNYNRHRFIPHRRGYLNSLYALLWTQILSYL